MAEVSNELILRVLNSIQDRMAKLEESMIELKTEMRAMRSHMIAIQTDTANLYAGQSRNEVRLERIERRLELADTTI